MVLGPIPRYRFRSLPALDSGPLLHQQLSFLTLDLRARLHDPDSLVSVPRRPGGETELIVLNQVSERAECE